MVWAGGERKAVIHIYKEVNGQKVHRLENDSQNNKRFLHEKDRVKLKPHLASNHAYKLGPLILK